MLRRLVAGAVAGAAGTLAMDSVWYRRARAGGSDESFPDWEFSASTSSFEEASAPGKLGAKAAAAVGVELPDEAAGITNDVVHWLTGIGYGLGHALLQHRRGALTAGISTGVGAFTGSYATMGALGLYQPIWEYDRDTLTKDLTAHLAFGLATGITYAVLTGRD